MNAVCSKCGNSIEVSEKDVLTKGTEAIVREGAKLSCSCGMFFSPGKSLVLEYELGDHSTNWRTWRKRNR